MLGNGLLREPGRTLRDFLGGTEMRIIGLCWLGAVALVALDGPAFAEGDATKGKAAFAKCGICHQVGSGAKTLVGPDLNNFFGTKPPRTPPYPYSHALHK